MSSRLIREAGETLYGSSWRKDLASQLRVSSMTLERWETGAEDVPIPVFTNVLALVSARVQELYALAPRLRDAAPKPEPSGPWQL